MIENISAWAKSITLSVVIVSIFEMLLPNKKMKQYIKVVMGLYILFNILSPLIDENFSLDIGKIFENTKNQTVNAEQVDQTSMNQKLQQIGEEELEKDITKKIEDLGFIVTKCDVKLNVDEETTIKNIALGIEKKVDNMEEKVEKDAENTLVEEIQKIKKIQVGKKQEKSQNKSITAIEEKQIKKFLVEEYEVKEECLKIN